ncbi:hypothetical protein [Nitriliruptor alkaliphilus]|uniref:hypothetical protein n=1 Tax=Nitriliruptor alkaliphilus TaxID=427918 RepID=UPI0006990E0F|nr:hypothetical protein [Nitriliruptor alkaliphilus]
MDEARTVGAGRALVVAGVVWSLMAVVQFRLGLFDHSAGGAYLAHQAVAVVALGLIVGALWLLVRARIAGDGRYARTVLVLFAGGWLLILLGGLSNLASGDGTGPLATVGMVLPAVGGALNGLTGLLAGIAVARAGRLPGWRRWSVLVYALYYLAVLWLPVAITGQPPSMLPEIGWGLAWILVGVAAMNTRRDVRATTAAVT